LPGDSGGTGPEIKIDPKDRAWISFSQVEANVIAKSWIGLINDVSYSITPNWLWLNEVDPYIGFVIDLATDPYYPDNAWIIGDHLVKINQDGTMGYDNDILTDRGETKIIEIAPRENQEGIKHMNHGGCSDSLCWIESFYRNSLMVSKEAWMDPYTYPGRGDHTRVGIGLDLEHPDVAYLSGSSNDGLFINVWDGDKMIFPTTEVYKLENMHCGDQGTGGCNGAFAPMGRFASQWAPVKGGGAFICWTGSDNHIKLKYVHHEGECLFDDTIDIGPGARCDIAADSDGNIHMVYSYGGIKYRKITTSEY